MKFLHIWNFSKTEIEKQNRLTHPRVCHKPVTSSSSSHEAQLSHISLLKLWKEERRKKQEIKSAQNAVICHLIPLKTTLGSSYVSCSLLLSFFFPLTYFSLFSSLGSFCSSSFSVRFRSGRTRTKSPSHRRSENNTFD